MCVEWVVGDIKCGHLQRPSIGGGLANHNLRQKIVCFRYQKYTYSRMDGHYSALSQLYGLEIDITYVHDIFPIDRQDRLYFIS